MRFVDREDELSVLEDEFAQAGKRASLAVVYGRRRVGKTELIKNFVSSKPHVYFLATLQSKEEVIAKFSRKAAEFFGDESTLANPHTSWDSFFEYLARELKRFGKPAVLVFDEFTYLIQQDAAVPSIFQYHWDEHLKDLPVMMVLCGSYVSIMEKEVLAHKSPLYGRRTRQVFVSGLDFKYLKEFFPKYSWEELVELYAVLGGVPYYLLKFDASKGVRENIEANFLAKDKSLFSDGVILLREELKEPRNYLSIMKAVAFGKTSQKEIADHARLEPALVGKYLDVLRGMKLVKRLVPVTEKNPEKSRKGLYQVDDQYYNFWLKFVYPYADYVEEGRGGELYENRIAPDFNAFVGRAFEGLARNALKRLNSEKKLPAYFERVGSWWSGNAEVDVVGVNWKTKDLLLGEVKWAELGRKEVESIVRGLEAKSEEIPWQAGVRKPYYCVVAKKMRVKEVPGAVLFDLDDLL